MPISYDASGYPTYYNGKNYAWTKGKLTRIHRGSAGQYGSLYEYCNFTYDGYGRRTSKVYSYDSNPGSTSDYSYMYTTTYDYDTSGRLIHETCVEATTYTGGSTSTRDITYLYDESGIIGAIQKRGTVEETFYFDKNIKGDVVGIYSSSGTQIAKYSYDAWGNCTISSSSNLTIAKANPFRYRGYYFDAESGFYFLNARYYNPTWRRFISPDDTAYLDPDTPSGLNLYAYCNNDPVNYSDPSGHDVEKLRENINQWFSTFVEYSRTIITQSVDLLFFGYEAGVKETYIKGNDTAPFSFFKTIPENWFDFFDSQRGVKINTKNGSITISFGVAELNLSVAVNNSSLDLTVGIKKIAIGRSYSLDDKTMYEQFYIRPIPILLAYAIIVWLLPYLLGSGSVVAVPALI